MNRLKPSKQASYVFNITMSLASIIILFVALFTAVNSPGSTLSRSIGTKQYDILKSNIQSEADAFYLKQSTKNIFKGIKNDLFTDGGFISDSPCSKIHGPNKRYNLWNSPTQTCFPDYLETFSILYLEELLKSSDIELQENQFTISLVNQMNTFIFSANKPLILNKSNAVFTYSYYPSFRLDLKKPFEFPLKINDAKELISNCEHQSLSCISTFTQSKFWKLDTNNQLSYAGQTNEIISSPDTLKYHTFKIPYPFPILPTYYLDFALFIDSSIADSGTKEQIILEESSTYIFEDSNDQEHTFTISSIEPDKVSGTITGTPSTISFDLILGEDKVIDVTGDGTFDIYILLEETGITQVKLTLTIFNKPEETEQLVIPDLPLIHWNWNGIGLLGSQIASFNPSSSLPTTTYLNRISSFAWIPSTETYESLVLEIALLEGIDPALLATHMTLETSLGNAPGYKNCAENFQKSSLTGCTWYPECSRDCSCEGSYVISDVTQLECTSKVDKGMYLEATTGLRQPLSNGYYTKCQGQSSEEQIWKCILCVYQGNYGVDIDGTGVYFTKDNTCNYADNFFNYYSAWHNYFKQNYPQIYLENELNFEYSDFPSQTEGVHNVLAIGDSITANGGFVDYLNANTNDEISFTKIGYGGCSSERIKECILSNFGNSGCNLNCLTTPSSVQTFNLDNFDAVIILAGANDRLASSTIPNTFSNLQTINIHLETLSNIGFKHYNLLITPSGSYGWGNKQNAIDNTNAINNQIKGIYYVETYTPLADENGICIYCSDGLHPNEEGHNKMGQAILEKYFSSYATN